MSVPLTINGVTFQYPQEFDKHWAPVQTAWSTAVTNALKPLSGGILTLPYPTSGIVFRNTTNTSNLPLTVNSSNQLTFNGTPIGATASLTDGHILVGNGSNLPVDVAMTGNVTISDTGVTTIGASQITNAMIVAAAGIAVSKLAALTASQIVVTDGSGFLTTIASPSLTVLGYLTGVTSAIQTQLNTLTTNQSNYLPLSGGTLSGSINMASNKITGITTGTNAGEALVYGQALVGSSLVLTATPSTGQVGEYIESVVTAVSFGISANVSDATSILLSAGTWLISLQGSIDNNSSGFTSWLLGISTTPGDNAAGEVVGDNWLRGSGTVGGGFGSLTVTSYYRTIGSPTTFYAKIQALFGGSNHPILTGARLSAVRISS